MEMKKVDNRYSNIIMNNINRVLSSFPEIEVGYIFGSVLKDNFRDIDIALLLIDEFSPYEGMKFAMKVGRKIEKSVEPRYEFDVKVLNFAPVHFQYEVIRSGKPVFVRDEKKRIRYEAELISKYLDYRKTLSWFNKKLLARA